MAWTKDDLKKVNAIKPHNVTTNRHTVPTQNTQQRVETSRPSLPISSTSDFMKKERIMQAAYDVNRKDTKQNTYMPTLKGREVEPYVPTLK